MNIIEIKPINIGIGGPLSALFTGLTGLSKSLPWWAICPLYFLLAAPVILLCPIVLPLWILKVIAENKVDEKTYHEQYVLKELSNLQASKDIVAKLNEQKDKTISSDLKSLNIQEHAKKSEDNINNLSAVNSNETNDNKQDNLKVAKTHIDYEHIDGIGSKDVNLAKVRKALLDENIAQDKINSQLQFHALSIALSKFKLSAFIKRHYLALIVTTVAYYVGLVVTFLMSSSLIDDAMARYMSVASEHKVLQIATQEQLEYANSVVNIISISGVWVVLMIISSFVLVAITALKFSLKQDHNVGEIKGSLLALIVKTLLVNLPGMGVLIAMLYACFINLERYYSHLRMVAMEAMVLGREYFDPTWLFLGLRFYLIYAFALALVIVILMSLHVLPQTHKSNVKTLSS